MTDTSTFEPLTEEGRANIEGIIEQLTEVGDAIGGYTVKTDCRQTGVSMYFKFEKKVDIMQTLAFTNQLSQAPAMLADACRKLLAADARIKEQADG